MEIWALSKRTGTVCSQRFPSFQDPMCPGNGAHRLVAKRITGHAGCCLLNSLGTGFVPLALGTPCAPFGNEKAENTERLNQMDFSRLSAADSARRGEGDVCRNQIKRGMNRSRRTRVGKTVLSGIKIAELRQVHTLLWFQFPPSYHALILYKCPPSNGTKTSGETPCQNLPAVQGFRRGSDVQSPAGAETIFGELRSRNVGP